MSRRDRIRRTVLTALTYVFVAVVHQQAVKDVREIELLDEPLTVYLVRKDGPMFAQSILFLGTILVNESRWDDLSDLSKRFILHHELSHSTRSPVFRGVFIGVLFSATVAVKELLMAGIWLATGRIATVHPLPVLVLLSTIVLFIGLVRIEETIADQQALEALGVEDFRKAYDEILNDGEGSLLGGVVRFILYTKPKHSIRLYHFRKNAAATIRSSIP